MSRMFWSTGCIVAASLLTASNASAGSGYEYYAPYPNTYQYASYQRAYDYAPYPRAYYYAPPTYAPGNYGYVALPAAYYASPERVWVPLRPSSCGQYRFWNGQYCADARYQPPYLGLRW